MGMSPRDHTIEPLDRMPQLLQLVHYTQQIIDPTCKWAGVVLREKEIFSWLKSA